MKHDNIKSIVLVLLIGLNVFLTGSILAKMHNYDAAALDNKVDIDETKLDITDYMNPQNFIVSFGGNDYSVFYSEPFQEYVEGEQGSLLIWTVAKKELRDFFRGVYEYEFITKEEFDKVKQFKSIRLQLGYDIGANDFVSIISGLEEKDKNISDKINTILIPATENQKKYVYLTNSKGSKYIKFTGKDKTEEILGVINNLKNVVDKNLSYKPLQDVMGTINDTIVPFIYSTEENNYKPPSFLAEGFNFDDKSITDYVNSFFTNSLDFTKEIAETDGTRIYMYGYGDRVLRINKDGLVEYFEKEPRSTDDKDNSFENKLNIAIKFITSKVNFPFSKDDIYISDYEYDENFEKHKFSFGYRLNGYQVGMHMGKDDRLIEVEIKNQTVIYYKSMIKLAGTSIINSEGKMLGFLDVIRNNIDLIRNNYYKSKNINPENVLSDKFPVADYVNDVMLTYYLVGEEFKPAWKIGIDDIVYYFDIYDGFNYTFYKMQTSGDMNELE